MGFPTTVLIFIGISTMFRSIYPLAFSRTRETTGNFELRPLLNARASRVLIPFAITGYKYEVLLYCDSPAVRNLGNHIYIYIYNR